MSRLVASATTGKQMMKMPSKLAVTIAITLLAACSTDHHTTRTADVAPKRAYEAGMADNWMSQRGGVQVAEAPPERRPAPAKPAPTRAAPAPAPAPQARSSAVGCSDPAVGPVPTSIVMPHDVSFGQEFSYDINVAPSACVGNVVIRDTVPAGATFVRSQPAAEQEGDRLRWTLGDMDKGQSTTIRVTLRADKEGTLVSCATVSADPRSCAQTFVGRPQLALQKTGPETAIVGAQIVYTMTVANRGTLAAHNVVVVDELPEGMISSIDTRRATLEVGDLAPGESKTVSITVKGTQRGKFCNGATASSPNAGEAKAEACTTFVQPGLKLAKEGQQQQFLGRPAKYTIIVSNTGDTPLTNVTVTDNAPSETSITDAAGGTVSGNRAVWNLGTLPAGEERRLSVSLQASTPGNHCNTATVATAEGLTQTAEACTVWRGVGGLLLEKADHPDPIQVGETTTYTVRVMNQGTADDTNVKVVVQFPAEIDPVSASNGGTIDGKSVTFPPFPRLAPKQAFEYSVVAKGVKAGDARVTFVRTSDGIPAPTSAEESTRVY